MHHLQKQCETVFHGAVSLSLLSSKQHIIKKIIGFSFFDIWNNQSLGKCYPTSTLIISDRHKTLSLRTCLPSTDIAPDPTDRLIQVKIFFILLYLLQGYMHEYCLYVVHFNVISHVI